MNESFDKQLLKKNQISKMQLLSVKKHIKIDVL